MHAHPSPRRRGRAAAARPFPGGRRGRAAPARPCIPGNIPAPRTPTCAGPAVDECHPRDRRPGRQQQRVVTPGAHAARRAGREAAAAIRFQPFRVEVHLQRRERYKTVQAGTPPDQSVCQPRANGPGESTYARPPATRRYVKKMRHPATNVPRRVPDTLLSPPRRTRCATGSSRTRNFLRATRICISRFQP